MNPTLRPPSKLMQRETPSWMLSDCGSDALYDKAVGIVAKQYGLPDALIKSRQRTSRVAWVRQVVAWALYRFGMSSTDIGRVSKRTHSTILWAWKAVEAARDVYPQIRSETDAVIDKLKAT